MWPDLLRLGPLEVLQDPHLPVEVQDGLSARLENLQPVQNGLWLVVVPLDKVLAGNIVLAGHLGGIEHQVVDPSRARVEPTIFYPDFVTLNFSFCRPK